MEPLDHFFKDEVRALGTALGLPDHIVHRLSLSSAPALPSASSAQWMPRNWRILKNALDAIVREELDAYNQKLFEETGERNSEHACWQYFAVLPDIKSVGVMGDERTYARPVSPARGGKQRRHDRRLGEAALRRAGEGERPHRGRGPRRQPRVLRHHEQAARDDRVGVG